MKYRVVSGTGLDFGDVDPLANPPVPRTQTIVAKKAPTPPPPSPASVFSQRNLLIGAGVLTALGIGLYVFRNGEE